MATRAITERRVNKLSRLLIDAGHRVEMSKEVKELLGEDPESVDPASYWAGVRVGVAKALQALDIPCTVDEDGNWIIKG